MKTEIRAQLGESDDLSKCTVLSFLKTHEIKAMQKNIKLCGIIWNSRFLAFSWRSSHHATICFILTGHTVTHCVLPIWVAGSL